MLSMKSIFIIAITTTFLISYVHGHGSMVMPSSWFDKKQWIQTPSGPKFDYVGMKSQLQCFAGCDINPSDLCPGRVGDCQFNHPGCACLWFNNYTFIEKPTLFDQKLRTYPHTDDYPQMTFHHPWRAPGFAHIDSPCGVAGGNLNGCSGGGQCPGGGYSKGPRAEEFHFKHEIKVTNWTRGSIVEAAWGISANHGGGYSYRLCKVPEEGVRHITEECFQHTPLEFVGNSQWIQYGEDETTRREIPAVRVSVGTWPKGSQWTKNPIAACNGAAGGFFLPTANCTNGTQFPPSNPDLAGFGTNQARTAYPFKFSIIDKLFIPKDLEHGNYVLSFRWDCEQTPQVWNTCAAVYLE